MSNHNLYLLRMELPMQGLAELARRRGLSLAKPDEGQTVHCALGELFRDKAPKLFMLPQQKARHRYPGRLEIYAYSRSPKSELLVNANAFGDVGLHESFNCGSLKERKLPEVFPTQVGFSIRLCPIVRLSRDVNIEVKLSDGSAPVKIQRRAKGEGRKKRGREVDAFEAACIAAHMAGDKPISSEHRNSIYLDWFDRLMSRAASVEVVSRRLLAQRWLLLSRRDHGRKRQNHLLRRPEILVRGVLRIEDQEEFRELLARGIGRHKAFGFGMLSLQPATEA